MSTRIEGSVVSISESGNLVTDVTAEQLNGTPRDERVTIRCDDHETHGIFDATHGEPASTLLALIGSSGCLELEIVGDSARIMLGVNIGERVVIEW